MKKIIKNNQLETHTIDATNKPLGRLASEIAIILMGKHKPSYQRHMDCGDQVVVKNVQYVRLTGKKEDQKKYQRYSGYPGGIKTTLVKELKKDSPDVLLKKTVELMLPKNKLRTQRILRISFK